MTFDDLLRMYLVSVAKGTNIFENYELLGKLKLYQELFPSEHQAKTIETLPIPLEITYVSKLIYRNGLNILSTYIRFKHSIDEEYSIEYELKQEQWTFDQQNITFSDTGYPLEEKYIEPLLSVISPLTHPAIVPILDRYKKKIDYVSNLLMCPLSSVRLEHQSIFFDFENESKQFYYDMNTQNVYQGNLKKEYVYDSASTYLFQQMNILERLKNHPNLRLKTLLNEKTER